MKKQNDVTLGDAIKDLLNTYSLNTKLDEVKLLDAWRDTLGTMINNHTQKIYVQNRKLFVKLDNAALKNELMYSKTKLIQSLNEHVGRPVIDELIIS